MEQGPNLSTTHPEGRGQDAHVGRSGRKIIGVSLGSFSTFAAGLTQEGALKKVIGRNGESFFETVLDLEIVDSEHVDRANSVLSAASTIKPEQMLLSSSKDSGAISDLDAIQAIGKFLGGIRGIAVEQIGHDVKECVISVPSNSTPAKIQRIVKAAERAGFSPAYPLKECVAIVLSQNLCYSSNGDTDISPDKKLVCTINVGCYSSEYSIVEIVQGSIKILDSERYPIGGEIITDRIYEEAKIRFFSNNRISVSELSMRSQRKLLQASETSKKSLIASGSGKVICDSLHDGIDCNVLLSAQKIESLCNDMFKQTAANIVKFFSRSGISPESMTHAVLVGGSMRMQKLQCVCKGVFGTKTEIIISQNPEESVVHGCALHAHELSLAPCMTSKTNVKNTSVEIHTLKSPINLLFKNGRSHEIFPEKSIIPASCKIPLALKKGQESIHVVLSDGKLRPIAEAVLNTSSAAADNGDSQAYLLVTYEGKNLISMCVMCGDTASDTVDICFPNETHTPVTTAA